MTTTPITPTTPVTSSTAGDDAEAVPQDLTVDRRWFLSRMAGVWAAAGAGGALGAGALAAPVLAHGGGGSAGSVWETAYAPTIRRAALLDPTELTISEAAAAFRRRLLDPVELMESYLDRLDRYDSVYQAYLWRPGNAELLASARRVKITSRSTPLAGIVTAEKDNFYTKDIPTTGMSPVYAGFVPEYDSTVHARLRAAGTIMMGKAAMGPLASGRARLPDGTATTVNAWTPDDIRYSPSGSSGGTATAVAGRLATSGTGTQTGGSITSPSTAQNLTGLKPTFGRASLYGIIPLTFTRDHPGPLARDAMDAAIMLQSFAGPDRNDPRTLGMPPVPNLVKAATVHRYRGRPKVRWATTVGYPPDFLDGSNPETLALRQQLLQTLTSVGCRVSELPYPADWDLLSGLSSTAGEATNMFLPQLRRDVSLFADRLPGFLNGMFRSSDNYMKMLQARYQFLHLVLTGIFDRCDVFLTGTVFDGIGLPLIAFPYGTGVDGTTGLTVPRGTTLGAPPFGEERLLAVVAAYQAVTEHHLRRPPDPTVTAGARRAGAYKVPAEYDATDET
ncbi:amidase [Plantactinospora soyae]|uniref:Asp-tRNA(Asn)/Glu-tRNA(Gln) amidotransferase A subunit family amidase n=1 Tax=Plantactinospora soyae TaxID=1544732 RepID=A0A927QZ71_9ACTN|nr:amidase [Plantactinospora soyae]MBE1487288.1 Asp-tRNA(Asn)/Glu-tRNA(Gln) amidotransferase A subunit family amidase [Plantactinospora soyae]